MIEGGEFFGRTPVPAGPHRETSGSLNSDRPETLDTYVGQQRAKALVRTAVDSSKKRNAPFPHSLISGAAGLGKTALARVIAAEMGVEFVSITAEAMEDSMAVKGLMAKLDDRGHDGRGQVVGTIRPTVLFVDEAHRLPRASQELLYSCVEDRVLDTKARDPLTGLMRPMKEWVPVFTLVAATNLPGGLTTSFRDRLRLNLHLEPYGEKDSGIIARTALERMGVKCGPKAAKLIAARGRGVPRKILGICEQVRDCAVSVGKATATPRACQKAFEVLGLDPIGLTRQDLEILGRLQQGGQPLGLKTLASFIGEHERAVEEAVEPYLLRCGLIARTQRGRAITPAGIEHLRQFHGLESNGRWI